MCHLDPPSEVRHLLPNWWECWLLSTGLSLAEGSCLSWGSSSWGQPPPSHWSMWDMKAQPCHLSFEHFWGVTLASELPWGPLEVHPRSASPSTLPYPALPCFLHFQENICTRTTIPECFGRPLASCPPGTWTRHFSGPQILHALTQYLQKCKMGPSTLKLTSVVFPLYFKWQSFFSQETIITSQVREDTVFCLV